MPNRAQGVIDAGFQAFATDTRGGGGAWSGSSIAPGDLPMPPGFLTPEEIAAKSKPFTQTKFFTPEDFLTEPTALSDPKLASRVFSSAPTSASSPVKVGASVSAYGNVPVPAFLTNAVQQLNATQSSQAAMQEGFRQQLLDAVLGGNYLAAEALRASAVTPGASVGFGGAVQNPQVGQAAVIGAQGSATQAQAVADTLRGRPNPQQMVLQGQLKNIQQQLGSVPSGFGFGSERAQLTSQQFKIQRELEALQKAGPQISLNLNSGFVPRSGLGV
jgi:hypothetical protein